MKTNNNFFRTLFLCVTILSISAILNAQAPSLGWKFAITASNAQLTEMHSDSIGNVYLIGEFSSSAFIFNKSSVPGITGNDEVNTFLVKIAPTGRQVWMKSIRGTSPGATIRPGQSAINERGELLISFTADRTDALKFGTFTTVADKSKLSTYLAKISKTGQIAWVNTFKVEPDTVESGRVVDLFLEESGTGIVTGYFNGEMAHLSDKSISGTGNDAMLFVASIGNRGEINWFNNCNYNEAVDNGEIWPTNLANTKGDYFYLGGYHEGYRPFYFGGDSVYNAVDKDAFLARYNKDGTSMWAKAFIGDSVEYIDNIVVNKADEATVLGFYNSSNILLGSDIFNGVDGNYDIFLSNITPDGTIRKSNIIPVQHPTYGHNNTNAVLKYDVQDRLLLCSEFFSSSLFSAATNVTNPDPGTCDMLMAQIDPQSLTPVWTHQGTAPGNNAFDGVNIDSRGNVYIAGTTYNALSFDGEDIDGNASSGSPYLMRMQGDGQLDYVFWQANTEKDQITIEKVSADKYGNSFVAGSFSGANNLLEDKPLEAIEQNGFFLAMYCRRNSVNGSVKTADGSDFNRGYIKLFGRTLYQRAPLNDTIDLAADGSFEFNDVPYGEYILSVVPDEIGSTDFVTTYFPSFEYWEFAESITIDQNTLPENHEIEMQVRAKLESGAQVGGAVNEQDSADMFKSAFTFKAKPAKKASVVLAGKGKQKSTYDIIATTQTDEFGDFEFKNVAAGSYYLWTDIPGIPVLYPHFFELKSNQSVTNMNYSVNEETVTPEGTPVYSPISTNSFDNPIRFYPNPATNYLNIELSNSSLVRIDIYNTIGAVVQHHEIANSDERIDVSNLANGNYFIRLSTEGSFLFDKFTIAR